MSRKFKKGDKVVMDFESAPEWLRKELAAECVAGKVVAAHSHDPNGYIVYITEGSDKGRKVTLRESFLRHYICSVCYRLTI